VKNSGASCSQGIKDSRSPAAAFISQTLGLTLWRRFLVLERESLGWTLSPPEARLYERRFPSLVHLTDCEQEMELSYFEKRRVTIWEEMREIEGELFLLSARSGEFDLENRHRFERLCGSRTKLANELLLYQHR